MRKRPHDVVVVGSGPAGSIAALVLARAGVRVALVDKTSFARDKACGDLVGPRGVALLHDLGLVAPTGRSVGEMIVLGPTGRHVVLPAKAGRTYPDHGVAVARRRFDDWLRTRAIEAGAEPFLGRAMGVAERSCVALDDGRRLDGDIVIGADGANSAVARSAGLVDEGAVLWGFASRAYVAQQVDRPLIALWNDAPRRGFPGYGWIFPSEDGVANVGLGIGVGADRRSAGRVVAQFDAFCAHLRHHGHLTADVDRHRLGGWLKMGMVGTMPARDRVLLVGDAAGLVNPLQGEGIGPAMSSGRTAARAILADPGTAARSYRAALASRQGRYAAVASPVHVAASATARRVAFVSGALTAPGVGRLIAAPWALLWNDLLDGAPLGPNRAVVRAALETGRLVSGRSSTARRLTRDLADADP